MNNLKGLKTLSHVSPWKDGNTRFTTVPLVLPDQVWIRYQCFCFSKLFIFICGFSVENFFFTASLLKRSNGETHRNKHFNFWDKKKMIVSFYSFDQSKVSKVSLLIGHCYLCMEGHFNKIYVLKIRLLTAKTARALSSCTISWLRRMLMLMFPAETLSLNL